MYVTLTPDLTVTIAAFHCQSVPTFLQERGVIEGSTGRINRFVLDESPSVMAHLWRAGKSMTIMPTLPTIDGDNPGSRGYEQYLRLAPLPHYLLHAWLRHSDDPDSFDGIRELVIAFFRDDVDKPITDMVHEAARNLDWYKDATIIPTVWH
jgi:hypothetical protein